MAAFLLERLFARRRPSCGPGRARPRAAPAAAAAYTAASLLTESRGAWLAAALVRGRLR